MRYWMVAVAAAVMVSLPACKTTDTTETARKNLEKSSEKAKEAAEKAKEATEQAKEAIEQLNQKRKEFVEATEKRLGELNIEINDLTAKVQQASKDAKKEVVAKWEASLKDLEQQRDEARDRLKDLQKATAESWEALRSGVQDALDRLAKTAREIRANFDKK